HLGDATVRVGYVAQPEGDARDLEGVVSEGQFLGVGLNELDAPRRPLTPGLGDGSDEHFVAEVGADNGHGAVAGAILPKGQVAGPGAEVEDRATGSDWYEAGAAPPPQPIYVQAEQVVE